VPGVVQHYNLVTEEDIKFAARIDKQIARSKLGLGPSAPIEGHWHGCREAARRATGSGMFHGRAVEANFAWFEWLFQRG